MKTIFTFLALLFITAVAFGQKTNACFTDTSNKNIVYPLIKCKPNNLTLDNCSQIIYDSVVWRVYFSTNTNCTGYNQSYDIIYSGLQSHNSINIPINQNGSYAITLFLYNSSSPNQLLDSIQKCVFVLSDPIITTLVENLCIGSSYTFKHQTIITSGNYADTLQSTEGCDSIINLNINFFNPPSPTSLNVTRCSGSTYFFNNQLLDSTGIYYDTLVSFSQCDSIISLKLNIISSIPPVYYSNSLCAGQTLIFLGDTLTASGTYYDTLISFQGCDSIIALNLTIFQAIPIVNIYDSVCFNTNYNFNGKIVFGTGIFLDTLQSIINGCDSIIQLHLFERPSTAFIDIYDTTCSNIPYVFNGSSFTTSGNYGFSLFNEFGCDSSMMLHLHVVNLNTKITKQGDTLIATGNGTIEWIDCSTNQIVSGAVNSIFKPSVSGSYAAIFTYQNCIESTDCINDTLIDGIENIKFLSKIYLFPNPTSNTINIKHQNIIKQISIQNIIGEIYYETAYSFSHDEAVIDVSKLQAGTYICKIIDTSGNITHHRFIKE
ncbi:MAG: hypothetical protein RL065_1011 [Bacteroidota bacterium]|jgi:hypothetical protein